MGLILDLNGFIIKLARRPQIYKNKPPVRLWFAIGPLPHYVCDELNVLAMSHRAFLAFTSSLHRGANVSNSLISKLWRAATSLQTLAKFTCELSDFVIDALLPVQCMHESVNDIAHSAAGLAAQLGSPA